MAIAQINEELKDQKCDPLEKLQQIEKMKNKDMLILLDKIVRKY